MLAGAYAHAPLLLVVIAWLVWRERDVLRQPGESASPIKGAALLLAGAALRVYGGIEGYIVLQGLSLLPLIAGMVLMLKGERAWRAVRMPVLMLLFVIPLPNAAIDAVTRPLLTMTADLVVPLLTLFDIDVERNAQLLTVAAAAGGTAHDVLISPACSGIRSLVTMLAVASLMAGLKGYGAMRTVVLLLAVPLLTVVGNVARVLAMIVLVVYADPEMAEGLFHSFSGLVLFAFSLAGLLIFDHLSGLVRSERSR